MDDPTRESPPAGTQEGAGAATAEPIRLPNRRLTALLAALTLGLGALVGAALGPSPESSLAGSSAAALARRLPVLLAAIAAHQRSAAAPASSAASTPQPEAPATEATPAAAPKAAPAAAPASSTSSSGASSQGSSSEGSSAKGSTEAATKKLPPVTSVWLIQLAGVGFSAAQSQATAAPYIDGQAIPAGTLLSGWSALEGSAFANDAVLAEPPAAGGTPPLMHSIVQPPCPEGAAGASCAPETPGQLQAADAFLKETLATITGTPAYKEHGLVVITFSSVAIATQQGLAAGTSSSTLTSQPPAGVLLLSPFARAGEKPTTTFSATSPRQSLEALLH